MDDAIEILSKCQEATQYYSRVMKKPAFQWPVQVSCGFFLSNIVLIKRMQSPSTKEILKAQGGGRWVSILHVRLCSIYDCSLSIYILPYAFYWSIVAGRSFSIASQNPNIHARSHSIYKHIFEGWRRMIWSLYLCVRAPCK